MRKLTIDFETRSPSPIKTVGAAAYAQHPQTEVICLALKWEGEDPVIWYSPNFREQVKDSGLPLVSDEEVKRAIIEADIIEAHNAQFEYFIWAYVMPKYGFFMFDDSKLRCSAAMAATCGFPRDLDGACRCAGVEQQKDKEGSRLMMRLCKPRRALKADKLRDEDWETKTYWYGTPEEFVRLGQYCLQDVRAEEALSTALPALIPSEQTVWNLDLKINDRGIKVDTDTVDAVLQVLDDHSDDLRTEFNRMTGLESPTQRDATLKHLIALGVQMDGLTKNDVEEALATTENETAKRILEIRKSLSKSSTAKYAAFKNAVGLDNRIRGCFMFYGAGTGRWAGRIVQPQNFPRGGLSEKDIETAIRCFRTADASFVNEFFDVTEAASSILRAMIIPDEYCDFICADFSAIEGRVLAWLAGEETALDVYRRGDDPYKVSASAIYHVPYKEVTKAQRQIGKVAELALGYNGGTGAFAAMAAGYGVSVPDAEAKDIIKKWRASRPMTVRLWSELERACTAAVLDKDSCYTYRNIKFIVRGGMLAIKLPSGRCLWYANPRIEKREKKWGEIQDSLCYDGVNSVTRKWSTLELYGGLLAENITQAVARDLLVNGMLNAEAKGYPIVLHVHDEAMAEVPIGFGSVEEFENLLCQAPVWAQGLPLKAEGWRGKRYKK
jgi:DNA polymerase